jgi:hypothetical protein
MTAPDFDYTANPVATRELEELRARQNREAQARRDEEKLAASEFQTFDQARAEKAAEVADLSPHRDVLVEHQRVMLCLRDGIDAELRFLDFIEKQATEAEHAVEVAFAAGDPEKALRLSAKADNARKLYKSKAPTVAAHQDQILHWDYYGKQDEIDALASRIADAQAAVDDDEVVFAIVAERNSAIEAAREKRTSLATAAWLAEYNSHHQSAAEVTAAARERHAEAEDLRQRTLGIGEYARKPAKPSNNAAAIALERMRQGQRVSSPVRQAMAGSVGGPNRLMPLDPTGARS